jgi:signal transduction histidine kinase
MSFESAPFILNRVIAEVCETMTIQATQKGIRLENLSNIHDNLCCEGDQTRLKQVLTNLISNAIKFTPRGKVVIQANTTPAVAGNFKLRVRVLDTGIGIDKADLPYVFDEFAQVAGAQKAMQQKGAGLGLAACKKIIELQGGSISVTSTPGEGSIFSFELPFKQLIQRTRHADSKLSYSSPQR